MDFVATTDFKSPYVVSTGMPHKPTEIKAKKFKKGEIIVGKLINNDKSGKPAFVLHKGVVVVPLSCVKQVVVKDITTDFTTAGENKSQADGDSKPKVVVNPKDKPKSEDKKKYFDAIIIGGVIGFAAVYYAEKKAWIPLPDKKNKIIGVVLGAALGAYLVYRFKDKK